MPDDILKTTITVNVDNIEFTFRIPNFKDEIQVGLRMRAIRRELELDMLGDNPTQEQLGTITNGEPTYDNNTESYIHTAAVFNLLLLSSDARWVYSPDERGMPVADFKNWPIDKLSILTRAGNQYRVEVSRFRQGGTTSNAPSPKVVAGGDAPGET